MEMERASCFNHILLNGTISWDCHYVSKLVYIQCIVCALFAGLMSGLTVGFLSIEFLDLEIKLVIGTETEKESARKVLPILKKHHHLLVTLLFCNACVLEALPIFLDQLVPSAYAILISVIAVLIVGEVVP